MNEGTFSNHVNTCHTNGQATAILAALKKEKIVAATKVLILNFTIASIIIYIL
jgi:hypothetical protein